MKNMKKKLVALAMAGAMVTVAGYGTLAYFQDSETVTNEFVAGNNIKIDLTETAWANITDKDGKDENNNPINSELQKDPDMAIEEWNTVANTRYQETYAANQGDKATGQWGKDMASKLTPSISIPKNPTVAIKAGSADCYVRMQIVVPTEVYRHSNLYTGDQKPEEIFTFDLGNNWTGMEVVELGPNARMITYKYEEEKIIKVNKDTNMELQPLFNKVTVKDTTVFPDALDNLGSFEVVVQSFAVQSDHLENANTAFTTAFPGKKW